MTRSLVVDITDIDDETPSCASDTFTITEPDGQTGVHDVVNLLCTDDDTISTITYSIISGDTTVFAITAGGILQIAVSLPC